MTRYTTLALAGGLALSCVMPGDARPQPDPVSSQPPTPIEGRLRVEDSAFRDDRGPVLPLYAHAGDLFSLFVRDRTRALAELDAVAQAGYHGVRTWAALGCAPSTVCPDTDGTGARPYWRGREVGPDLTPEYFAHVRAFLEALRARRLRAVWSLGDVHVIGDRRSYMTRLASIDAGIGAIDWIDCGNEAWQGAGLEPSTLATCIGYYAASGGHALKTLTSPPTDETDDLNAYSVDPADAFDVHASRGGHSWDKRRHIASLTRDDKPPLVRPVGINSEPPGAGALVSATEYPEELDEEAVALLAVASLVARQAFVWFSGEGVQIDRGLATAVGFENVPRAVGLLPKDVMRYRIRHHSGPENETVRVLVAQGEVRIDGALDADGRFVYTIDGPPGTYALPVARSFEGSLCHPATAVCTPASAKAGGLLRVSFTRGRILIGSI